MAPRVSVLIPTYNCARFLPQAIESVLAQSFQDFEIIVVDDGSTDDTTQVVARYPRVRYILKEHSGISASRNAAVAAATGEIVTFLDADDLWLPQILEKQVAYLDADPACMLVYVDGENFYQDENASRSAPQQELFRSSLRQCVITCAFRRIVFEKFGLFRTDYANGEDTQFFIRLKLMGVNMEHRIPEVLYRRRIHTTNISLEFESPGADRIMSIMADTIREIKQRKKEP